MNIYWDSDADTWIMVWSDGAEYVLRARDRVEAQQLADAMEEDEGILYEE
jgi:hypothetical protein